MTTKASTGISNNLDSKEAGIESCTQAMAGIKNPELIIVFSSVKYNQKKIMLGIKQVCGDAPIVGCSSSGEISSSGSSEGSVVVMAIESNIINFVLGTGGKVKNSDYLSGKKLAKDIKSKDKNVNCLIMFTDVLNANGADVVRGVQSDLGKSFFIAGGAAGDDFLFKKTFEYHDGEVLSSSIVGFGLSGEYTPAVGVRHGWSTIGIPVKVTKSNGSILEELDEKPAASIYEDYFGKGSEKLGKKKLAKIAITYPLGMETEENDELLLRAPISFGKNGTITCAAEIPEGSEVRLMIRK